MAHLLVLNEDGSELAGLKVAKVPDLGAGAGAVELPRQMEDARVEEGEVVVVARSSRP